MNDKMTIEPILVTQATLPPMEEYIEEIKSIWESHWLTNMGEKHNKLQSELEKYLMVDHVSLFTNGHMALELLLQAMGLKGEVITTPFTFASTTHAIVRNGLEPVFCDIRPDDYTMDASKIEELITEKTCAILPVHVYGNVCDVEAIQCIADKYNIPVIYDAAHAFGVKYKGRGIASYGYASMFSFHATKVFNTIEGGAVCFADEELGKTLYRLKNFGIKNAECVDGVGANAKMNEFQAAMGLCNLKHIDENIAKRKIIFNLYNDILSNVDGIKMCNKQAYVEGNYSYLPIYIDKGCYGYNRDELSIFLSDNNIFVRKYFYPLTSNFECYKYAFESNKTPVAVDASANIVTLPLYAELSLDSVYKIGELIKKYSKR